MDRKEYNKTRILEAAKELFYRFGYSRVTMDDIANHLGMSKKTLYKYFKGKNEIMRNIVDQFKAEVSGGVEELVSNEELEYPVKLKRMLKFVAVKLSRLSNLFLEDVQKNFPDLWNEFNEYKNEAAFQRFKRLIEEGKKKAKINPDINHYMIIVLYASAVQNLLDPRFLKQIPTEILDGLPDSPGEIFDNMINIIYEGILTDETKEQFKKS